MEELILTLSGETISLAEWDARNVRRLMHGALDASRPRDERRGYIVSLMILAQDPAKLDVAWRDRFLDAA